MNLNMLLYFIFMLMMSLVLLMLSVIYFFLDLSVMLEWVLLKINSMNIEMYFLFDWVSLVFLSVVLMISSMVMLYSIMYMLEDLNIERFYILIILFVLSMVFMIISPNVLSILIGWDGLGVTSYCLVIYYQNYISYNSGMVTVLVNRVGDIGILMAISLMLMYGSWNMVMLLENKLIMFLLIIASITKSAQIPFSSWLPMAMAAPTPVSSLVHSSTLVTAGVYLMIRFSYYLNLNDLCWLLLFLSVMTMFMSGLMANFENDLKKIIALSTLSQLGLMMMSVSIGMSMLAFYHLLTHALFKSMLFLCAGILIHSMNNNQDIRKYGGLVEMFPFTMMSFFISSLALSGMPFLSGFYSKDLIMEMVYDNKINVFILLVSLVSLMFTVSYSFRLFFYMFFSSMKFVGYICMEENKIMGLSMMILVFMSIIGGSLMNWMFFFYYNIYLGMDMKLLTLFVCLLGILLFLFFMKVKINYYLLYFFSSMWMMNYMYIYINKPVLEISGVLNVVEKTWMEYLSKMMFLDMFLNIFFSNNKYSMMFKVYSFFCFFLFLMFYLLVLLS